MPTALVREFRRHLRVASSFTDLHPRRLGEVGFNCGLRVPPLVDSVEERQLLIGSRSNSGKC